MDGLIYTKRLLTNQWILKTIDLVRTNFEDKPFTLNALLNVIKNIEQNDDITINHLISLCQNDIFYAINIVPEDPRWAKHLERIIDNVQVQSKKLKSIKQKVHFLWEFQKNNNFDEQYINTFIEIVKKPPYLNTKLDGYLTFNINNYEKSYNFVTQWIKKTFPLAWQNVENSIIRSYYDFRFSFQELVPFIDFFKAYQYENKSNYLEHNKGLYTLVLDVRKNISQLLKENATNNNGNVESVDFLDKITSDDISCLANNDYTLQFFLANDLLIMPRGAYGIGYGRYYSRFDHLLQNIPKTKFSLNDTIICDLGGDDYFNGNEHDNILEYSITLPLGRQRCNTKIIDINDLFVRRENKNNVSLYSKKYQKKVYPIDLGYLEASRCSPVKKLLKCFSPSNNFSLPYQWDLCEEKILTRPRIYIDSKLVIYRKAWLVQSTLFPKKCHSESDEKYFSRIHYWLNNNDISTTVFVKLKDKREILEQTPFRNYEIFNKYSLIKYTNAFFLDFNNPWSILKLDVILNKLVEVENNAFFYLELEESLPQPGQDVTFNEQVRHVEYFMEINI